jgi:hypothetical protein
VNQSRISEAFANLRMDKFMFERFLVRSTVPTFNPIVHYDLCKGNRFAVTTLVALTRIF